MKIQVNLNEAIDIVKRHYVEDIGLRNCEITIEQPQINNHSKLILSDYFLWQLVKANLKIAGIKLIRDVESQFGGYISISDAKAKIEEAFERIEKANRKV